MKGLGKIEKVVAIVLMALIGISIAPAILASFTGIAGWVGVWVLVAFLILAPLLLIFKKGDG